MQFNQTTAYIDRFQLGTGLSRESAPGVLRVALVTGAFAYVREDGCIDALGVGEGYCNPINGCFHVGDPIATLFTSDKETPIFGGEFVEIADFILYFRLGILGISLHPTREIVEDGPFSASEWAAVLATPISKVVVAKHDDRVFAY